MARSHAIPSINLGPRDPRGRRGQGQGYNEGANLGAGLTADREGRISVDPCASVGDLPKLAHLQDVASRLQKLLESLRAAGLMEK